MKNWTIAHRITAGGATVIALLIVVAVTAVVGLRQIDAKAVVIQADSVPSLNQSGAISVIAAQGFNLVLLAGEAQTPGERESYLKQLDDMVAASNATFEAYAKNIAYEEDRRDYQVLIEKRDAFRKLRAEYLVLIRAEKKAEANKFLHETLIPAQMEYSKAGDVLSKYNLRSGEEDAASIVATSASTIWTVSAVSAIALLVGVTAGSVVILGLNKTLRNLGDTLGSGASQVTSAAAQVSSSSQSLAQGASEQAASLEETSSSLEEMAGMTSRNAESANKASELAKQARNAADTGAGDMQAMSTAMTEIKTSSDDIAKIIKTIDEIAFQTNILALNAAVEAARAGDAGMGFAVVAEEVRALAQRSAQAARETADKIEGAINKTAQGVEISEKVSRSLTEIVEKVRQVDQLVAEVSTASREQSQGVSQITTAVAQMDKVVQGNAAGAEESASAAEELNAQSFALQEAVAELLRLVGSTDANRPSTALVAPKLASQSFKNWSTKIAPGRHGSNGHASSTRRQTEPALSFPKEDSGAGAGEETKDIQEGFSG